MNLIRIKLILCAIFAFPSFAHCQVIYEREYRIRKDTIAENACIFINQSGFLEERTKVKWYREESEEGISIEAKFKQNKKDYSIEFSKEGELQDVEMEIDESEVPVESMKSIRKILEDEFLKWKIKKIQRQWVGPEIDVIESIKSGYAKEEVEENFEIVIKGRTDEDRSFFELLFNEQGELISKGRILEGPGDILIY